MVDSVVLIQHQVSIASGRVPNPHFPARVGLQRRVENFDPGMVILGQPPGTRTACTLISIARAR
jgi:hypothetical protein